MFPPCCRLGLKVNFDNDRDGKSVPLEEQRRFVPLSEALNALIHGFGRHLVVFWCSPRLNCESNCPPAEQFLVVVCSRKETAGETKRS